MKKKICFVVAIAGSATSFLKDHIAALSNDYDIYLVANVTDPNELMDLKLKGWHNCPINRQISIINDIKAVKNLTTYFRDMKFDAVHSVTPKAGLVCAIAAKLAGIKHRIHIFTGQVWATKNGLIRTFLKFMDKIIASCDNHILVDGNSQRDFLIREKVVKPNKAVVLGDGSICGVNTVRFNPDESIRINVRRELNIQDDKIVFVFMGRLNHDKGLHELLPAFNKLASENKDVFLLIFGRDEENVSKTFSNYENLNSNNFLYYGLTPEPQKMLQAGDIFVLPTYREGFGSSVIEAACLGMPTITSDAYGVLDASVPGETGLQCKVGDMDSLYECMKELADDRDKRIQYGRAGRIRVLKKFSGSVVVNHWMKFYCDLLSK